nr:hypothetical protein [Tanacetum cinerariifolium]
KVDTCKALDASLVNTVSSGRESVEQDTCSKSGNNAHVDDADIRPIYDEEPTAEKFIKPRISLNDEDGIMARKYFLEYTKLKVRQFRDTLIQHMESVKKSIDERALHKREYDTR